jgi:Carboxypeptidase regulatory-like domain
MGKPTSVRIEIPDPCNQDWSKMTPTNNGRFCDHCQTNVVDFSGWTDAMLFDFFSKKQNNVCGRYDAHQVSRTIKLPYQPQSRLYRIAVSMGLVLMFTQMPSASAKRAPYVIENVCAVNNFDDDFDPQSGLGSISGRVSDENHKLFAGVKVELIQNKIVVGRTTTDSTGEYSFSDNLAAGVYDVKVTAPGYRISLTTAIPVREYDYATVNFKLHKQETASQFIDIYPYLEPPRKLMGKMIRHDIPHK